MNGGCFDCEKKVPLKSITVPPTPRDTSRGKMPPGAWSIALCPECFKKEVKRAVVR